MSGVPDLIVAEANAQGVPPELALGIWRAEGMPDMSATSPKGAVGAMQLMPGTAADLGVDPRDLAGNIKGGVGYLKQQLATFKGDHTLAAAAYNAGPGAVMAHGGVPPYRETQDYVRKATGGPGLGSDIFGDGPAGGPAADDAPPGDGADIFTEGPGSPTEPDPPTPPATIKAGPKGQILFADTGVPVPEHQAKTIRILSSGGMLQLGGGAPGSVQSPWVQRAAGDQFKPGEYYIDAESGKLAQTPGGSPDGNGGFLNGVGAGLGDIPNSIMKLLPGSGGSDVLNASEAHRLVYDASHRGDTGAAAGRFSGQVLGSIPLMAGGDALLAGLAGKAPEAIAPALRFFAGQSGKGFFGRTASRAAQGALQGAEAAAVTSGTSDASLPSQLAEGAVGGAIGGAVLSPALGAAGRGIKGMFGGRSKPADQATAYVLKLMQNEGASPDSIAAADPLLTGAEAIGPSAELGATALASQPGQTNKALNDVYGQRKATRGDRVLDAISEAMGIAPEAAQGSIDAIVKQGQAEAEPLYKVAHAAGPVWNEKLGQLSQTNAGKQAVKYAHQLMSNELEEPDALGMTFVENPEQWASYVPPPIEAEAEPVGFAGRARGPARAPTQGPSLLKYIADTGGIYDPGGDVNAMGGDRWHVGKAYQRKLTDGGRYPDTVAQAAWEAGYFPQHDEAPTTRELFDAMGQELRGKALYARQPNQTVMDRFHRANADEELAYRGSDPADVPNPEDYVGRPAPRSEPAYQHVPNAKTIDYIKRGFDQQLAPYYSGKLEWDDVGRSINNVRTQWLDEAKALNPHYAAALDRSGDYLSAKDAFERGGRLPFNSRIGPTRFAAELESMTPPQLLAFRAGMANRIHNEVLASRTQPTGPLNTLLTPIVQSKLRMMLGEKSTTRLKDALSLEARMKGGEDYYGPKANSRTASLGAAIADQQEMGYGQHFASAFVRHLHRSLGAADVTGVLKAPLAGIGEVGQRLINEARTPGLSPAARDEAGRMLLSPPEALAELLRQANRGPKRPPLLARPARSGMIGASAMGARNEVDQVR